MFRGRNCIAWPHARIATGFRAGPAALAGRGGRSAAAAGGAGRLAGAARPAPAAGHRYQDRRGRGPACLRGPSRRGDRPGLHHRRQRRARGLPRDAVHRHRGADQVPDRTRPGTPACTGPPCCWSTGTAGTPPRSRPLSAGSATRDGAARAGTPGCPAMTPTPAGRRPRSCSRWTRTPCAWTQPDQARSGPSARSCRCCARRACARSAPTACSATRPGPRRPKARSCSRASPATSTTRSAGCWRPWQPGYCRPAELPRGSPAYSCIASRLSCAGWASAAGPSANARSTFAVTCRTKAGVAPVMPCGLSP